MFGMVLILYHNWLSRMEFIIRAFPYFLFIYFGSTSNQWRNTFVHSMQRTIVYKKQQYNLEYLKNINTILKQTKLK